MKGISTLVVLTAAAGRVFYAERCALLAGWLVCGIIEFHTHTTSRLY